MEDDLNYKAVLSLESGPHPLRMTEQKELGDRCWSGCQKPPTLLDLKRHIWLTQGQHDLDYGWAVTLSGVTPYGPPFTWIMLSTLTCVLWLSSFSLMFSCLRSTLTFQL